MVTAGLRSWYPSLAAPKLTPPVSLFGLAWMILYVMIGVAGWRVWKVVGAGVSLLLWGWQLLLNALWPAAFFGLRLPAAGLLVLLVLLGLIAVIIARFARIDRVAAALFIPYLGWAMYTAYLNAGFWWLN
jgi:tryptophan-rich sensory protein